MKKTPFLLTFAAVCALTVNCACAYTLHLPDDLTIIKEQAFKGNPTIEKAVLPENLKTIESGAFAESGLSAIYSPDISGMEISPDAFGGKVIFRFPYPEGKLSAVCGEYARIEAFSYPARAKTQAFSFTSGDTDMLSVDESGQISPVRSGDTSVILTNEYGLRTTLDVSVQKWSDVYIPISIAHRGASGYRHDNTIAAFEYAIELGAGMIELDVMKTSDGKIICFHDASFKIDDADVPVSSLTYPQMLTFFPRLCTLEEALACVAPSGILLQIEIKAPDIEEEVLRLVSQSGMEERIYYGCFRLNVLQAIRALKPDAQLVYIVNRNSIVNDCVANPENFDVDILSLRKDLLSEERIARLHLAGKQVYGWTINTSAEIEKYIAMGLDGVISNYPDRV